jgi:hypothetical protein
MIFYACILSVSISHPARLRLSSRNPTDRRKDEERRRKTKKDEKDEMSLRADGRKNQQRILDTSTRAGVLYPHAMRISSVTRGLLGFDQWVLLYQSFGQPKKQNPDQLRQSGFVCVTVSPGIPGQQTTGYRLQTTGQPCTSDGKRAAKARYNRSVALYL